MFACLDDFPPARRGPAAERRQFPGPPALFTFPGAADEFTLPGPFPGAAGLFTFPGAAGVFTLPGAAGVFTLPAVPRGEAAPGPPPRRQPTAWR